MTTPMKLKVHGFVHLNVTYEITVDMPDDFLGRELEFVTDHVGLPTLATLKGAPHAVALVGADGVWETKGCVFREVFAEPIEMPVEVLKDLVRHASGHDRVATELFESMDGPMWRAMAYMTDDLMECEAGVTEAQALTRLLAKYRAVQP